MKSVSAGLLAHLAGQVTTLATCWKVTRQDGRVFAFTDHVADLSISGITYSASSGYTASAIQTASALNVDNLEVQGALSSSSITEEDLLAGLWDFADIEIFQVNYADLTQGTLKLRRGQLGEVRTGRNAFAAELRGMMQRLQQAIGRIVAPACNADLGDSRCGINLGTFTGGTVTGTVTSVGSQRVPNDSALAQATGWFAGGLLTWTGGLNSGLSMEVKAYTSGGIIELVQPMPFTIQIGDTYSMTAGCGKSLATCRDKFNNVVNFRGFPHLPGIEGIASGT